MSRSQVSTNEDWLWVATPWRSYRISTLFYRLPTIVFLKFLSDQFSDDIEKLAEEAGDKSRALELVEADHGLVRFFVPEQARWSTIEATTERFGDRLTKAVEAIAAECPTLAGMIDAVEFHGPPGEWEELQGLIQELGRRHLSSASECEVLPRAIEFFLERCAESAGVYGGDNFTPSDVAALVSRIIAPEHGMSVYDPCLGSGSLLTECHRRILETPASKQREGGHPPHTEFYGQARIREELALAMLRAIIQGFSPNLALGDALENPRFVEGPSNLRRFDLIASNPLWGQRVTRDTYEKDRYGRFSFGLPPTISADWGWVQHMYSSLTETGRLAVVLDSGALTRGAQSGSRHPEATIRERFLEEDLIEAIVLLPKHSFHATRVSSVIIVVNKAKKHAGEVLFINASKVSSEGQGRSHLDNNQIDRIAEAYHSWKSVKDLSAVVRHDRIVENTANLWPARYVPLSEEDIPGDVRARKLASDAQLEPVACSDVLREINLLRRKEESGFEERENAVYLPLIGTSPAVASVADMRIKPHNYAQLIVDPTVVDARYFANSLNTAVGRAVRRGLESGHHIPRLTKTTLKSATFYLPSKNVQDGVNELVAEIRDLRASLLELEERVWSRPFTWQSAQTKMRSLLKQGEGLKGWIDTLPYPLASVLQTYLSARGDKPKYEALLHFYEAVALFTAAILLSVLETNEPLYEDASEAMRSSLRREHASLRRSAFGTWVIIAEVLAKATRQKLDPRSDERAECAAAFRCSDTEVLLRLFSSKLISTLKEANHYRNTWHGHGGAVGKRTALERHVKLRDLLTSLREVYGEVWLDYVLVMDDAGARLSPSGVYSLEAKSMMGPTVPFPVVQLELIEALVSDSLYLMAAGESQPLKLLPLVQVLSPPDEARTACYFYNKIEGDKARYISYHYEQERILPIGSLERIFSLTEDPDESQE